jgi:hypothetical protein
MDSGKKDTEKLGGSILWELSLSASLFSHSWPVILFRARASPNGLGRFLHTLSAPTKTAVEVSSQLLLYNAHFSQLPDLHSICYRCILSIFFVKDINR